MRSSQTISLFSERPEVSQKSSSFAVSILVHSVVFALLGYGLLHPPPLRNYDSRERMIVRSLEFHLPDPVKPREPSGSGHNMPSPGNVKSAEGAKSEAQMAVIRQAENAPVSHLTLLQPKLKNLTKLPDDTPLPTVVIWKPDSALAKVIIPPQQVKLASAPVLAAPQLPNREERLADVRISSSDLSSQKLPILPSTTSPLTVHGPDAPPAIPTTSSASSAEPTPAAIVSISDLRMPEGKVIIPAAEASSSSSSPGALTQGKSDASARADANRPAGTGGTKSQGTRAGDAKNSTTSAGAPANGVGAKVWPSSGSGNGANTKATTGSDEGNGTSERPSVTRIALPRNGVFGSVVVGVSLQDRYPETAGLLGGRIAYTVYLHVGMAKSWILQYSLPSSDDAASAGNIAHVDAPWPYNIVRPNIPSSILDADALILHGFINKDGHFENLKVVFPTDFSEAQFVLDSLTQWQFRTAMQNGEPKRVEVLLIIPNVG
jgi:hypothetical protein